MTKFELQKRTKKFHVDVLIFCSGFPKNAAGFETAKQLIRSAGSVGANYRAACRGKSKADFVNKLRIVEEEADESAYWLEIISEAGLSNSPELINLLKEAGELTAIFTAAGKTAKANKSNNSKTVRSN